MSNISEKLITIAENTPKVYYSGKMNVVKSSDYLKGSESGSSILVEDVSPVEHTMSVKVRNKNLFDISKIRQYASLTNNGDGTLTMKAEAQAFTIYEKLSTVCPTLKVGDKICFSFVSQSTKNFIYLLDSKRSLATYTNPFTVAQADLDSRLVFYGYQSTETNYGNPCTISNIQIELGATATAYTPYVPDLTSVKVSRYGKNLFDQYKQPEQFYYYKGISIEHLLNQEAVMKVSLKENGTFQEGLNFGIVYMPKNGSSPTATWFQTSSSTDFIRKEYNLTNITYDSNKYHIVAVFTSSLSQWQRIVDNYNIQIELGTVGTEYEKYIPQVEYTPNADGTVDNVTSIYPSTTLISDTSGALIDCEYYKDIDKAYNELTTSIALSGGE